MICKTEQEIVLVQESALLVSKTLAHLASLLKPGVTTLDLDIQANEFIRSYDGAIPSFLNYGGFPYHICTSVNDAIVHGFPNKEPLLEGDIVSIDIGVLKNGYHGDHAYTFIIGEVSKDILKLVRITKESLYKGIEQAVTNNRTGDIGNAIQSHVEQYNYGIVRSLVGHGLGKNMHEEPDVPNYGQKGKGVLLKENMILAIEPMINLGLDDIYTANDEWTILTQDGKVSVHFEHDICVKNDKPLILSDFSIIEKAEVSNKNLNTSYYSN